MTTPTFPLPTAIGRLDAWQLKVTLYRDRSQSGTLALLTGQTGLTGWLASAIAGVPISDVVSLSEYSGNAGTYAGTLTQAQVTAALASIATGATVYEVIQESDGSRQSRPYTVVDGTTMQVAS